MTKIRRRHGTGGPAMTLEERAAAALIAYDAATIGAAAAQAAAQAAQDAEYAVASVLARAADSALGTAQRAFCATWDLSDGDAEEYEWDYEIAGRAHEAAFATVLQIVRDADEAYAASYVLDEDRKIGLISEHFWFMGASAEGFFE